MDVHAGVLLLLLGAAPVMAALEVDKLHDVNGTIQPPEDPSGNNWYKPNARHLWIVDVQESNINIELTVEAMDLGEPYTTIQDEPNKHDYTKGDFLLIGAGSDILLGDDAMFYGFRSEPKKVVIRSGVGHVFFYSTQTVTKARGFNITYTTTGMSTPTPPPTTTTTTLPPPASASISINGIPVDKWWLYNETCKVAIAKMASNYAYKHLNLTNFNVPPSDVMINNIKYCHPDFCEEKCVTYDFSVVTMVSDEAVFNSSDLEDMLEDSLADQYITDSFGSSCEICMVHPGISLFLYIAIPVGILLLGLIITFMAWSMSDKSTFNTAQEKYEQAQREKIADQRRRSTGDISILGVGGGSLASQGSRSSRRYTMPFPKTRTHDDISEEEDDIEEEVDTSGFVYYDPDQGITDPAQFNLGGVVSGFMRQGQESHQYMNKAFVTDEDTAEDIQRTSFAVDSDTDSDNGGALSFPPDRTEMTYRTKFEVPAQIHSTHADGHTAL